MTVILADNETLALALTLTLNLTPFLPNRLSNHLHPGSV